MVNKQIESIKTINEIIKQPDVNVEMSLGKGLNSNVSFKINQGVDASGKAIPLLSTLSAKDKAAGRALYPNETVRATIDKALGKSYLVKDQDGSLLANYNVSLEQFEEVDNSINLEDFVDSRTIKRNGKAIFQTDQIVNSKNFEINQSTTSQGTKKTKTLRNVEVVCNLEYGTQVSEINTRDIDPKVAFDLLASDMNQHSRMNRLIVNRFLIKKFVEAAEVVDTGLNFDNTISGASIANEYKTLGAGLYPTIYNYITQYKEVMTKYRPGGFSKNDITIFMSPVSARACVDYQSSLPSSDSAFQVATSGDLWNFSIDGVRIYETNLLKAGQTLDVDGTTEYSNSDNVEVLIIINGYTKYVKATPFVQSVPLNVDGMDTPYLIGQKTENMHNALIIVDQLFKALTFTRGAVVVPPAEEKVEIKEKKSSKKDKDIIEPITENKNEEV